MSALPSRLKSCDLMGGAVTVDPICTARLATGLTLPATSVARTWKTCVPLACASHVFGEAQVGSHSALAGASWHSNRAPVSVLLKLRLGVVSNVGEDGNGLTIDSDGATVSTLKLSVPEVSPPATACTAWLPLASGASF